MNRNVLILIGILALVVLGVVGYLFFVQQSPAPGDEKPLDPFGNAFGTDVPGSDGAVKTIYTREGEPVRVPDFTKGRTPTPGAGGNYYDLVHDDGPVFGDEGDLFFIQYGESGSEFTISLVREPLGESRLAAESLLRQILKTSDEQLCALNVNVGTPMDVNAQYGKYANLGLSFCPGAVLLP